MESSPFDLVLLSVPSHLAVTPGQPVKSSDASAQPTLLQFDLAVLPDINALLFIRSVSTLTEQRVPRDSTPLEDVSVELRSASNTRKMTPLCHGTGQRFKGWLPARPIVDFPHKSHLAMTGFQGPA
jgi:hypothetical protein